MLDPRAVDPSHCALLPHSQSCALEYAPIGIMVTDPNQPGNPLSYVNKEFCLITGYQPAEVMGRGMALLTGPGTDPNQLARIDAAVAARRAVCEELVCYRKSGESFVMRLDLRPVYSPHCHLQAFVGGLSDMTHQHRAQEALAESEERLRAVMTAIPLPMLTLRHNGAIARANAAAHTALRVPRDSLPGRSVWDFVNQAECPDTMRLCSESRFEIPAHRADGELMWALASAKNYTVRGETRSLVVFQDVTELKQKERALQDANEEAERNIRARMRFLAAASHDLRQPLQAMALFASALDHHVASPQGRTIVQSLKTSLRGMEEMFDSLLDMSKLDAGVMKAEPHTFLINDVLEQMEMTYAAQAEAAGLRFRVVPSSAVVHSDPRLLARIIGNFISNAIRYTRKGCVLVGVRRRGPIAAICVLDTGPGIPENQRLEIFREFSQGAGSAPGRERGTGLGLAIVQRLSMLLGHRVGVQSRPGHGSAFCVHLPLAEEASLELPEDSEDEDAREVAGATVMVVDDDRNIQDGLGMLLQEWGCRPVITGSAEEALSAVTANPAVPDVILADVHLRNTGGGLAAIQAVRHHIGREVPAFLFTGDTEYPAEVGEHVRVLRKPLDPLRLRTVLADALGR